MCTRAHAVVIPSPRELNVYHGLTLLGGIVRIDVQESFLRDIVPHVYSLRMGGLLMALS